MTLNRNNKMNSCCPCCMATKNSVSFEPYNWISNWWFLILSYWWSIWFIHNKKQVLNQFAVNGEKRFNLILIRTCIVILYKIESFHLNTKLMNTKKMRFSFLMNIEKNFENLIHNILLLWLNSFSLNNYKLNLDNDCNSSEYIHSSFVQ